VDIFRVVVDHFAYAGLTCVQRVVITSVIDDPDIADDEVFNASPAISVDHIVRDQGSGSIGAGRRVGAVAQVHNDAVAVTMIGRAVVGAGNNVVGNNVVKSGIAVVPLRAIERYSTRPATVVSVVIDDVMVGRLIVAILACDSSSSHIADGIADVFNMVRLLAEEAISGNIFAVERQAFKFEVAWAVGEARTIEVEHGLAARARPHDVDRLGAIGCVSNPCARIATVG